MQLLIMNRIKADPVRATGMLITDDLSRIAGRRIPDAQVFLTLSRLKDRGLVEPITREETVSGEVLPKKEGEKREANGPLKHSGIHNGLTEVDRSPSLKPPSAAKHKKATRFVLTGEGTQAIEAASRLLVLSGTVSFKGDDHDDQKTPPLGG